MVGNTTNFNISNIVGIENVGKYTADDFICRLNASTYTSGHISHTQMATQGGTLSYTYTDYQLTYDNTTGDVSIVSPSLTISCNLYDYGTKSFRGGPTTTRTLDVVTYMIVR